MSQTQHPMQPPRVTSGAWAGWVAFASIMLMLTGAINGVQGFVALFQDDYFLVRTGDELLITDFTGWGIIMLVWATLLVIAGWSLFAGRSWARWFAVFAACLSILVQIAFLNSFPIWSAMIIALDVLVIFALSAHWDEAIRT
jgi:hypothetical protein